MDYDNIILDPSVRVLRQIQICTVLSRAHMKQMNAINSFMHFCCSFLLYFSSPKSPPQESSDQYILDLSPSINKISEYPAPYQSTLHQSSRHTVAIRILILREMWFIFLQENRMIRLMILFYINLMSIRRVKKKKIINLVGDAEEQAKQRLIEVSFFDEGNLKQFDQCSFNYAIGSEHQVNKSKVRQQKQNLSLDKKKSRSLCLQEYRNIDCEGNSEIQSVQQIKKTKLNPLKTQKSLFNKIQSTQVFVGHKANLKQIQRVKRHQINDLSQTKRMQTMPSIKQKQQFSARMYYSPIKRENSQMSIKIQQNQLRKLRFQDLSYKSKNKTAAIRFKETVRKFYEGGQLSNSKYK